MRTKEGKGQPMTDKPVTTYVVSVFEAPHRRTVVVCLTGRRVPIVPIRLDLSANADLLQQFLGHLMQLFVGQVFQPATDLPTVGFPNLVNAVSHNTLH
jgi:hypothetical protein